MKKQVIFFFAVLFFNCSMIWGQKDTGFQTPKGKTDIKISLPKIDTTKLPKGNVDIKVSLPKIDKTQPQKGKDGIKDSLPKPNTTKPPTGIKDPLPKPQTTKPPTGIKDTLRKPNTTKPPTGKDDINVSVPGKDKTTPQKGKDGSNPNGFKKMVRDTTRREAYWCEIGDGAFTKDGNLFARSNRNMYSPLMLTAILYDTTKDGFAQFASSDFQNSSETLNSDNTPELCEASPVIITPNIESVVPGDTMVFAVSYRIPSAPAGANYKLVFFYHNSVFDQIDGNPDISVGGTLFPAIRFTHGESLISPGSLADDIIEAIQTESGGYTTYIVFNVFLDTFTEKNIFITLRPSELVPTGSAAAVKAVLLRSEGDEDGGGSGYVTVGQAETPDMFVDKAHDPNYITQDPHCIITSKNNTTLNYRVHFQNDGAGVADMIVVRVGLPAGTRFTDLTFDKALIGNQIQQITVEQGAAPDSVIFSFNNIHLTGAKNNPNGYSDPNTMGDIFFAVKTNSSLADTIYSQAAIYFHSEETNTWEEPVLTRKAVSYFSRCCHCQTPSCFIILGLCWWWWVVIGTGIIILWWFIIWRRRKRKHRATSGYIQS